MILITGGKGFIGTHLRKSLKASEGFDIRDGKDIRDRYALECAFEMSQCDTVIHLAALAGVRRSKLYPNEYISTNIIGTWNVGKMCEKYGCRLIFFSSSCVYGNSAPPTKEGDPKDPISLYGITKLAGEQIVNSLSVPTTIIRPFTVYGPGGRRDQVLQKWAAQYDAGRPITIYGDEDSVRGYIHIYDLCIAIQILVNRGWSWKRADFNLGGKDPVKLSQIRRIFQTVHPDAKFSYQERPAEDMATQYADISKARSVLQWEPLMDYTDSAMRILRNGDHLQAQRIA